MHSVACGSPSPVGQPKSSPRSSPSTVLPKQAALDRCLRGVVWPHSVPVDCAPVAILSRKLIIISANFTGRTLTPRFLTVFTPVFGGAVPSRGRFGGPVSRNFGENLILYLRKPNYKQSRDSKCFCVIGLGSVRQGWQGVPPCQPSNCLDSHDNQCGDSNIWGQITAPHPGGVEGFSPVRPYMPPGAISIPEQSRPEATPVPARRRAARSS